MPALYHGAQYMNIDKRRTRVVRTMEADTVDRIQNGPRPAQTTEYEFSGGNKKVRGTNEIYSWVD